MNAPFVHMPSGSHAWPLSHEGAGDHGHMGLYGLVIWVTMQHMSTQLTQSVYKRELNGLPTLEMWSKQNEGGKGREGGSGKWEEGGGRLIHIVMITRH